MFWCVVHLLLLDPTFALESICLRRCSIVEIVVRLLLLDLKCYTVARMATEMQHIGDRGATAVA